MSASSSTPSEVWSAKLGHRFKRPLLLEQALTHPSWAHENEGEARHFERLEFLGDAVIGLVVADLCLSHHVEAHEGELTRRRAQIVRRQSLAAQGTILGLAEHLRLGAGQKTLGANAGILADATEAFAGALFLDGGLDAVRKVFASLLKQHVQSASGLSDAKTMLQQYCQKRRLPPPKYRILGDTKTAYVGQDIEVALTLGIFSQKRRAPSKKLAEQLCAEAALAMLEEHHRA